MPDEINVQPEVVSNETNSNAGNTTNAVDTTAKQPSQEELIRQMVAKEIESFKEQSKRELQSTKDRYLAEIEKANRRVKATETIQANALKAVVGDDPELQKSARLAQLEAEKQLTSQMDYEEMTRRQQQEFDKNFKEAHVKFVKKLGFDPDDKRIDWGDGEGNYLTRLQKILDSVSTIATEKLSAAEKKLLEYEAKEKKKANIEANSVDTANAAGASSDAEFVKAFGNGTIPATKENMARYRKIYANY